MSADANLPAAKAFDGDPFDEFYDRALPVVYGYLLRLCGGDRDAAWDLTQDSWLTVVDRLGQGRSETTTIGFLLSVARSRYLDAWRRQRRLQRKLRLAWAGARQSESAELSASKVLDHLSVCSDEHRVVLMLAYVDDLPVAEIAQMLGTSVSSTYSLLGRARHELRSHLTGDPG
jgi:RNA polymerase sigma-70 factor, ECF subfamily